MGSGNNFNDFPRIGDGTSLPGGGTTIVDGGTMVERQFQVVERQTQVVERRSGPFRLNLTTEINSSQCNRFACSLAKTFWTLISQNVRLSDQRVI